MGDIDVILDLYDRAWQGPAWHGPSLGETLEGVTAAEAAARPLATAHTIWELAEHVIVWQEAVRHWIAREEFTVTPEIDFPATRDPSEAAWVRTRERLQASRVALRASIAGFTVERLRETRGEGRVPWHAVLHGVIHHALYHAGQIAMLRKAARA